MTDKRKRRFFSTSRFLLSRPRWSLLLFLLLLLVLTALQATSGAYESSDRLQRESSKEQFHTRKAAQILEEDIETTNDESKRQNEYPKDSIVTTQKNHHAISGVNQSKEPIIGEVNDAETQEQRRTEESSDAKADPGKEEEGTGSAGAEKENIDADQIGEDGETMADKKVEAVKNETNPDANVEDKTATNKGKNGTDASTNSSEGDESDGGSPLNVTGVVIIIALAVGVRRYAENFKRGENVSQATQYQGVATRELNDDDDWDWDGEDSSSMDDVELPGIRIGGTQPHTDVPTTMSMGSAPSPAELQQPSPIPQPIQKLATSSANKTKKKKVINQDDDIFAEMGLSSVPAFATKKAATPTGAVTQHSPTPVPSGSAWESTAAVYRHDPVTTRNLDGGRTTATLDGDKDLEENATEDWGDDDDLDDLLND